jgi:hypothetical protein
MQVARTAASAVAFGQTCFGNTSESAQAVALTMASMNDDKLLRFFDVCPKYASFKGSVEQVLVRRPRMLPEEASSLPSQCIIMPFDYLHLRLPNGFSQSKHTS